MEQLLVSSCLILVLLPLLVANALTQVSEALASGKRCFLDAEDWRSVPDGLIEFPLLPSSPELYHAIFGHFAAIPGLLGKCARLGDDRDESLCLSLPSSAETLREDIMQWFQRYISEQGGLRAPLLENPSHAVEAYPFHSAWVYTDVLSASILTVCYAYLIVLNKDCLDRLQPNPNRAKETLEMALAICMSVDYCSRSGYCGAQTMKFALPIALSVLPAEYRGWAQAWLERFRTVLDVVKI